VAAKADLFSNFLGRSWLSMATTKGDPHSNLSQLKPSHSKGSLLISAAAKGDLFSNF
jgi:hypothetical protein